MRAHLVVAAFSTFVNQILSVGTVPDFRGNCLTWGVERMVMIFLAEAIEVLEMMRRRLCTHEVQLE